MKFCFKDHVEKFEFFKIGRKYVPLTHLLQAILMICIESKDGIRNLNSVYKKLRPWI